MKASFFSFVAAAALFATTAASAAPLHDRDLRRLSPRERARYEQAQREREHKRQLARERARQEAQHRAYHRPR